MALVLSFYFQIKIYHSLILKYQLNLFKDKNFNLGNILKIIHFNHNIKFNRMEIKIYHQKNNNLLMRHLLIMLYYFLIESKLMM